jgi:predicted HNH restriction endonuclease
MKFCSRCRSKNLNYTPWLGEIYVCRECGYKGAVVVENGDIAEGRPFMEVHHLVPMKFQEEFTVELDVPENIVSLCPNCHRIIHHAIDLQRKVLLRQLYGARIRGTREGDRYRL